MLIGFCLFSGEVPEPKRSFGEPGTLKGWELDFILPVSNFFQREPTIFFLKIFLS